MMETKCQFCERPIVHTTEYGEADYIGWATVDDFGYCTYPESRSLYINVCDGAPEWVHEPEYK